MRRVLARIDADARDRAIGTWLADQQLPPANPSPPPPRPPRQAIAVDGKTLRGTGHRSNPQVHLLAVMDHIAWRNRHARDEHLGRIVKRAKVA